MFDRDDFAQAAGDQWDEAFWLMGEKALTFKCTLDKKDLIELRLESCAFKDGGILIARHNNLYMIIDIGSNGQNGNGGHAHNDTMSFEFFAGGQAWIVDPGTFVYTADYEMRNLFRSTKYHNTPQVFCPEALEQNRFEVRSLFNTKQDATCIGSICEKDGRFIRICLYLENYAGRRISLKRTILVDTLLKACIIQDMLPAMPDLMPDCTFAVNLHHASLPIIRVDAHPGSYLAGRENSYLLISSLNNVKIDNKLTQGWIAPGYGHLIEATTTTYYIKGNSSQLEIIIGLYWSASATSAALEKAIRSMQKMRALL
jgi:hypothetical protein